jgi:ABC-2 type transport system ATP-binding protein
VLVEFARAMRHIDQMYALEIDHLRKTYKNGVEALKGVSLTVQEGDFFALLGPNGAGKSTLIGIISSLVNATSGEARVFGTSVQAERSKAMSFIGLVPQELNFNQFEKPLDIVVNQAGYYGIPRAVALQRAEKYLKKLQLWDKADKWSRTLSGGMKRRLMIARAMVNEPRLLILDEPTAGVDIEIRRSMWDFIREINDSGTTVILTTHYLEEAESLCRNIAIIDHGEIIQNTDMKSLLATLDIETFVLDLREPIYECPIVEGMDIEVIDENTLEASLPKKKSLNNLFGELDRQGINVLSMRNKANRLEELFLRLVEKGALKGELAGGGGSVSSGLYWTGYKTIVRKEVTRILRIWGQTIVPPAITMTLYFIIFGELIGRRIGEMGGFSYMQYIVPGLVIMSVITNSYGNMVSSFFGAKFGKHIEELLISPLPNGVILAGYVTGALMRGLMVGVVVMLVSLFFTRIEVQHPLIMLTVLLLTAVVFALAGMVNAIYAQKFDDIAIIPTFVLAPLTYLGGVFYSISLLPEFWQNVSVFNPILYMVNGFRLGMLGVSDVGLGMTYGVIGTAGLLLFAWCMILLHRGTGLRT